MEPISAYRCPICGSTNIEKIDMRSFCVYEETVRCNDCTVITYLEDETIKPSID